MKGVCVWKYPKLSVGIVDAPLLVIYVLCAMRMRIIWRMMKMEENEGKTSLIKTYENILREVVGPTMGGRIIFYVLSRTQWGQEAEELLKNAHINYEKIDVEEKGILPELDRTLGIRQLPAIEDGSTRYEGIEKIREFVRKKEE